MASTTSKPSDSKKKSNGTTPTPTPPPGKLVITLKCSPDKLVAILKDRLPDSAMSTTTATPARTSPAPPVMTAAILPPLAPSSNAHSAAPTPGNATLAGFMAPPPADSNKKRTTRARLGPKKKQKLEEGVEIANRAGHRLGPKANMGAINAGLRALDRTGKPCRKWVKRGFTLKTFTGVVWKIPRWTAPARATLSTDSSAGDSGTASTGSSNKENKADEGDAGDASDAVGGDVEMEGAATAAVPVMSQGDAASGATPFAAAS